MMDSTVLDVKRCADLLGGGREGGPLAGLFPGSGRKFEWE